MVPKPLVSIITPTFNHEKFIGQCIQSVLDQTYANWEMLIVNDGSTDNTSAIAAKYSENDPRIRLFDRPNCGIFRLAETYNFALEQSKGELIAILEGDDFWVNFKLEKQVKAFLENPGIIVCWGRATSVIGNETGVYETHPKSETKNLRYYFNDPAGTFFNIVFDDFPPPLTFLISREALVTAGRFRQIVPFPAIDLPTFLALSRIGKFYFIPEVLGSWRQHANQVTKNNSVNLIEGSRKIILEHYGTLTPEQKRLVSFDLRFINKIYKELLLISYARSGRFKLIRSQYKEARQDYRKAIFTGLPFTAFMWKLRAFTGLILSYFRTDVEGLARMLGKKSFR